MNNFPKHVPTQEVKSFPSRRPKGESWREVGATDKSNAWWNLCATQYRMSSQPSLETMKKFDGKRNFFHCKAAMLTETPEFWTIMSTNKFESISSKPISMTIPTMKRITTTTTRTTTTKYKGRTEWSIKCWSILCVFLLCVFGGGRVATPAGVVAIETVYRKTAVLEGESLSPVVNYRILRQKREPCNNYRGGTSDATTSSTPIASLMTFNPQNRPYSSFENNTGQTDGRTDGRTRPLIEMRSRI